MSAPLLLSLQPHPATPCEAVNWLTAALTHDAATGWKLRYTLNGDLARLRIPAPAARPAATDGLWRRTCFECFVASGHGTAYREFNFSPSGDWAAYAFSAERVRDPTAPAMPAPRLRCTHDAHTLMLDAWVADDALPVDAPLGLCAVIEAQDGSLSYWALRHPAPRPDFHHRDGWTARLPVITESSSRIPL